MWVFLPGASYKSELGVGRASLGSTSWPMPLGVVEGEGPPTKASRFQRLPGHFLAPGSTWIPNRIVEDWLFRETEGGGWGIESNDLHVGFSWSTRTVHSCSAGVFFFGQAVSE